MKKLSVIFLTLFISCNIFSDDDDLIPSNREIEESICIGIMFGGVLFLLGEILFPDPDEGSLGTGVSTLCSVTLGAAMEEALYRMTLQPLACSFIYNRLVNTSENTQQNRLIARHSANAFCSMWFGAAHLLCPYPSMSYLLYATLAGYYHGELCYRYGRITVITSHITVNVLTFVLLRSYRGSAGR